jgi:hypothetical protein
MGRGGRSRSRIFHFFVPLHCRQHWWHTKRVVWKVTKKWNIAHESKKGSKRQMWSHHPTLARYTPYPFSIHRVCGGGVDYVCKSTELGRGWRRGKAGWLSNATNPILIHIFCQNLCLHAFCTGHVVVIIKYGWAKKRAKNRHFHNKNLIWCFKMFLKVENHYFCNLFG